MALISCTECKREISSSAISCPNCGNPNKKQPKAKNSHGLLYVGVLIMPIIFAWFTLKKSHSNKSRIISFTWMLLILALAIIPTEKSTTESSLATQTDSEASQQIKPAKDTIESLLLKLSKTPKQNHDELKSVYFKLLAIEPNNEEYQAAFLSHSEKAEQIEKQKKAKQDRDLKIQSQFSPWDGSHSALESTIKRAMNDPDSYQHARTTYIDKGDYLIVRTEYRGKNAFGATIKNFVTAQISIDGEILQIIDQS